MSLVSSPCRYVGAIRASHGNLMPGRDCPYGGPFPDVSVVVHA